MASSQLPRAARSMLCRRTAAWRVRRHFTTSPLLRDGAPPPPPLLQTLRQDLKTSLRAKDTQRLLVIRALLADVTDASKTSSPVQTDVQLLSLVRKRVAAARQAMDEAEREGRADLVEKERAQADVLESYAGQVQTWGEEKVRAVLGDALAALGVSDGKKVNVGDVLKRVFAAGGEMDGQPVERARVAALAKQLLAK